MGEPLFDPPRTSTQLWPAYARYARWMLAAMTNGPSLLGILLVLTVKILIPRKPLESQANWMLGCLGISSERLGFIL